MHVNLYNLINLLGFHAEVVYPYVTNTVLFTHQFLVHLHNS